jgi:hypothetical protein
MKLPQIGEVQTRPVRHVAIYHHQQLVLKAADKPGVLASTAHPTPQSLPKQCYLDAQATWAPAENALGALVHSHERFDDFVDALLANGYDLLSIDDGELQRLLPGFRIYQGGAPIGAVWNRPGQFMTLAEQPAVGKLQSDFATMTIYDAAAMDPLYLAFATANDFGALLAAIQSLGMTLAEI